MMRAKGWLAFSLFCAVTSGAGGYVAAASRREPAPALAPAAPSVHADAGAAPASLRAEDEPFTGRAVVTAKLDTVLTAKVRTRILTILVKPGDFVKAGTPVAEIDKRALEMQLAAKKAELAAAYARARRTRVAFDLAGRRAKRADVMAEIISVEEREKTQHEAAEAQSELAERQSDAARLAAELEVVTLNLRETALVTPHDGTVSGVFVRPSEWLEPGKEILRVVGMERSVRFAVPTDQSDRVPPGARLAFDSQDGSLHAAVTVTSVGRHADGPSRMVFAEADFVDGGHGSALAGLSGTVSRARLGARE